MVNRGKREQSSQQDIISFTFSYTGLLINGREMLKFNKSKYISKKTKAKKIE